MSIRTHFCVVQCYSQLGWPVIKGGKSIWNPDPHHGFVDAFLFSAIWHALGGKRGLERPGLDVAVTALAGGELTVGDEFWARHGENGVTSDAFLEALVACKDRDSTSCGGRCSSDLLVVGPLRVPNVLHANRLLVIGSNLKAGFYWSHYLLTPVRPRLVSSPPLSLQHTRTPPIQRVDSEGARKRLRQMVSARLHAAI